MKNISKKIFGLILAGAVLITGCTAKTEKKDKGDNTKGKLKVVTTIFPEYDITRAIAKDKVDLELMIKPGVDVHSFTPTPQDIKTVQNSDIFVYGGTEHDKWVENLTKSIDMKNKKVVKLVDGIQQLEEESVDGMKHEHHHDDEKEDEHNHDHKHEKEEKHSHDHENESDKELDPHYWTSPKNAIQMAKTVTNALVEKDPGNAEFYKENAKNYIKQLEDVDKELHDVVDKAKIKKVVIADRFPFRYLFKGVIHIESPISISLLYPFEVIWKRLSIITFKFIVFLLFSVFKMLYKNFSPLFIESIALFPRLSIILSFSMLPFSFELILVVIFSFNINSISFFVSAL